jgi:hypothetical protein
MEVTHPSCVLDNLKGKEFCFTLNSLKFAIKIIADRFRTTRWVLIFAASRCAYLVSEGMKTKMHVKKTNESRKLQKVLDLSSFLHSVIPSFVHSLASVSCGVRALAPRGYRKVSFLMVIMYRQYVYSYVGGKWYQEIHLEESLSKDGLSSARTYMCILRAQLWLIELHACTHACMHLNTCVLCMQPIASIIHATMHN